MLEQRPPNLNKLLWDKLVFIVFEINPYSNERISICSIELLCSKKELLSAFKFMVMRSCINVMCFVN